MSLEVKGVVKQMCEVESGTSQAGKEWKSQNCIITTLDPKYPKDVCIKLMGDKINSVMESDKVTMQINVESREYNNKWYSTISAWKVEIN